MNIDERIERGKAQVAVSKHDLMGGLWALLQDDHALLRSNGPHGRLMVGPEAAMTMILDDSFGVDATVRVGADKFSRSFRSGGAGIALSAGATPLMMAALMERLDLIINLHSHGADVNTADRNGITALIVATVQKNHAISKYLVEVGQCNIDATDNDGYTAWHRATEATFVMFWANSPKYRAEGFAAEYYSRNATASVKANSEPQPPTTNTRDIQIIVGRPPPPPPLPTKGKSTVKALTPNRFIDSVNPPPVAVNRLGETPLFRAASLGSLTMIRLILDFIPHDMHEPYINKKDTMGRTALTVACTNCKYEAAELLISSGGDVSVLDLEGGSLILRTSSAFSYIKSTPSRAATLQVLLDNGSDLNTISSGMKTVIEGAESLDLRDVTQQLADHGADVSCFGASGFL